MIRVLHLIDETTTDDATATLRQFAARVGRPGYAHVIGLIGRVEPPAIDGGDEDSLRFGDRWGWRMAAALPIRTAIRERGIDVVHAWSASAGAVAQIASRGRTPVIVTVGEPPVRARWSRWRQAAVGHRTPAIVCPSRVFYRRAIEAGLPGAACGVIRPAVDFAAINEARRMVTRESLGLNGGPVVLVAPPPSRAGGHYYAMWAAAILQQIWPALRVLLPGESSEARRMERFVGSFGLSSMLRATGRRVPFERLLAAADVVVAAAIDDVATGPIAWAMAAGVPIVGCAVPAIAEFIADRDNGLLCKPGDAVALAGRIRWMLSDEALRRRLADRARGQAFDVFSLTRMANQYRTLYDNVLAERAAFDGIADAAMEA